VSITPCTQQPLRSNFNLRKHSLQHAMDSSDVCTPPQSTLPTLFVAGLLNGAPLNVKPVDLGGRVWVVALEDGDWATVRDWRGGERGVMAVKKITGGALPQDGLNEARLLARMDHPNVSSSPSSPVDHADTASQVLALYDAYLVPLSLSSPASTLQLFTPYYAHPLSALLASPAASEPRVATALVAQMLDAVLYIHAEGIAHRDVGTPNFVVGSEGRVVLIDFGISLDRSEVSGTLGYIQELPGAMHFEVGTG
jgi:serine/threonine protein kinase